MALVLNLKCVENIHGKADRIARVAFRGHAQQSKLVRRAKRVAYFGQTFEWPIARPIEKDEFLSIQLLNYNKYLSNKVAAVYVLSLQQVIEDGELKLNEPMVDLNNKILETTITFEINYYSPDGRVGKWGQEEFIYPLTDDNLDDYEDIEDESWASRNNLSGLPGSLQMTESLRDLENGDIDGTNISLTGEDTASQTLMLESLFKASKKRLDYAEQELHKPKDFQICIRIIEGQQLAGLDIDPVVKIQVGDEHKYTAIKQSTNCPFFDEYFVFDFRESPTTIFDKMITISVYHAYGIPGRNVFKAGNIVAGKRMIGVFKCDVATVYTAPNHMYYHKWALLMDPKDMGEGPKGYIKCDISVAGKGDVVKAPKGIKEEDTNDIDGNLLLPLGISKNRESAVYSVNIYRAEDLPRTDYGIMASVRKAISRGSIALVDAYVRVSLAGHVGKTSVSKSYHPEWKESLKFVDKFPPLCNRIKVQLYDSDALVDESIGTHFIELNQIMDPGGDAEGILPTYGPSWINFYGAPRSYRIMSEHDELNVGLGEGSAYRGRLLMSISTQIVKENIGKCQVINEKLMRTGSLMENQPRKEYLLFATIFEATMIDKDLKDKQIYFEISMGHYGNTLDGSPNEKYSDDEASSSDEDDDPSATLIRKRKSEEKKLLCKSTTTPEKPLTTDKNYYFLPYAENKQCLYVYTLYEDTKRRLYHTNILERIVDDLEDGLDDVKQMLKIEYDNTHQRLRGVLKSFEDNCQNYINKADGPMLRPGQGIGKTDLDKYRIRMCKNKVDRMKTQAQTIKSKTTRENVHQKFREAREIARKLKKMAKDPQHSLPDIFIWMIAEKKRVAYYRIQAKDIMYSNTKDFIGKNCGRMQTIFIRKVGKKSIGPSGWVMQGKVTLYLWLGDKNTMKKDIYLENLPPGYEIKRSQNTEAPPDCIIYKEKQMFQLRAYLYQARSLIGSDDTGLSDPFARVIVGTECKSTQYIDETLSPTWDEMLIFNNVTLFGPLTNILDSPPVVIAEIYDHDQVGQPEFLGRAIIKPKVKTSNDIYVPPEWPARLEWHDVYRGPTNAGEILASFELIQQVDGEDFPPIPDTKQTMRAQIIPIPQEIKPLLKMFRVEVLFWGVREPKRIQLLTVDRPRANFDIAGKTINSSLITNMDKNSNFDEPLKYIDVMLPENELFWPPITIRVVDCRKFGRDVLVGTCTITQVQKYIWVPPEERERQQEEIRKKKLLMLPIAERKRQEKLQELTDEQRIQLQLVSGALSQGIHFDDRSNTPLRNGTLSVNGSVSIAMNLDEANAQLDKLSMRSNVMSADSQILSVDSLRLQPKRLSNAMSLSAEPKHVTINVETIEETPSVMIKSGQGTGSPEAITSGASKPPVPKAPSGQTAGIQTDGAKKKAALKKRREMIADLDWWSKYYVTKEDLEKEQEQLKNEKNADNKRGDVDTISMNSEKMEPDYEVGSIDYESFDEKKIAQLGDMQKGYDSDDDNTGKKKKKKKAKNKKKKKKKWVNPKDAFQNMKGRINEAFQGDSSSDGEHIMDVDDVEEMEDKSIIARIKVYQHELEKEKEFAAFEEWVQNYNLFRGKKIDDEDNDFLRISGRFKGTMCIYELKNTDDSTRLNIENKPILKLSDGLPNNKPVEVKIMLYVIRALDLHPVDANGKADPYMIVRCGRREINDKENKQNNQLNPVFGKLFEFDVVFPMDSNLRIQVMDYDTLSADDLIGETTIDLENRFYSKHRARCGLQNQYEEYGYNIWRDPMKPTQILEKLCRDHELSPPKYGDGCVHVGNCPFYAESEVELETGEIRPSNEHLALEVLKNWEELVPDCPLVPEHLESRSLYIQDKPGVEQGRLEMWVDMFPKDMPQPSVTVDITPRQPKSYELRCIIWNTDEVVLEDTNMITGEASSDIFVKGYLKGIGEDDQSTDVHYRSLTGEGNFNWRFVFPFDYLKAEERIVYKTKGSVFDTTDTELKVPAKLTLQVWDADIVSADDFLGYLTLDLNRIPRPFKDAKKCTEKWMKRIISRESNLPTLNIFKCSKGCRGWWPMVAKQKESGEDELVGKVEAELQLLPAEEAERNPAGLGRSEPNPLPEPNRPDTAFLWFMNPFKTLKYIIWKNYKWTILKVFLFLLLVAFISLMIYTVPGATVNKIFGT